MKASELIKDNFYSLNINYTYYIFRFEKIEYGDIYSYGYEFDMFENDIKCSYHEHFCSVSLFEESDISIVYFIDMFMEYLPNSHPHKINYLRKKKISGLLN